MSGRARILVVEDEAAIQELLRYSLEQAAFEVVIVPSAEAALEEIRQRLPALVLLDLMLPGMSGSVLAKRLRSEARTRELPIIMVTARGEEADRIQGLEIGADDYVSKPFSPKELIARIRAVLRRRAPHLAGDPVEIGPVRLDPGSRTVTCHGQPVTLGPTEFELLQYLMNHPNRALTRDQLLNALRGDHRFLEDRTIDVYIRRLRAGLGPVGEQLIETVRGIGYKLASPSR
ncbi:response regulator [Sulfuricystis thermophila]|uniref:response regulator n=1 Tax=Sulfuricystis thermophila TaxID=2496847 RepID=UPI001036ED55|nr:response regulator [Sulfuricystis thermophila]